MKSLIKVSCIFITILFTVINCSQEKIIKSNGQLQFSFEHKSNSGGRVASMATPAFALLSIKDSHGTLVENSKKIALYNFGGDYVTEALQLSTGDYSLTQFIILDSDNNVLYATPMEGSDLAQYVNDPLPINFSITNNGNTLVKPQVLAVTPQTPPASFGYVSFGFEVVDTNNTLIKEYETFVFKDYPGTYVPEEKHVFIYTDGKLTRKEYYYYLEEYKLYYFNYYETFEYDAQGRATKIVFYNNYGSTEVLWRYYLSYPSVNSIQWDWYTVTKGYPDMIYYTYLYNRSGVNFTMDITEFPGQPGQSKYFFDGYFSQSNNAIGRADYYQGVAYDKITATYDNHPNPLKSIHEFFKTASLVSVSDNNPIQIKGESIDKSSFSYMDYTYEYNALNYPVKCIFTTTDQSNKVVSKKMMTYKY